MLLRSHNQLLIAILSIVFFSLVVPLSSVSAAQSTELFTETDLRSTQGLSTQNALLQAATPAAISSLAAATASDPDAAPAVASAPDAASAPASPDAATPDAAAFFMPADTAASASASMDFFSNIDSKTTQSSSAARSIPADLASAFPLPYLPFSDNYKFVGQGELHLVEAATSSRYFILGPLMPCLGIVLYNPENDRFLMAHKYTFNQLDLFQGMIKQYLAPKKLSSLQGEIYSFEIHRPLFNKMSHEGRSQIEEIRYLKDKLEEWGLTRSHIRARMGKKRKALEDLRGDYHLAPHFMVVDKETVIKNKTLTVHSVCPIAEDLCHFKGKKVIFSQDIHPAFFKRKYAHFQLQLVLRSLMAGIIMTDAELHKEIEKRICQPLTFDLLDAEDQYLVVSRHFQKLTVKMSKFIEKHGFKCCYGSVPFMLLR